MEVGLRLASGNPQTAPSGALVGGQSITANTDMNSLESRKFILGGCSLCQMVAGT